jgi:hypothetical protein
MMVFHEKKKTYINAVLTENEAIISSILFGLTQTAKASLNTG